MLDERRSLVLQALVEEYIRTGEPVSSQTILERTGLEVSSATIRNDLAKLESYGFVTQPHTSAGRVPTHQGYRFYVDHIEPGNIRARTRARIEAFFSDMHRELGRLLEETTGLLAEVTSYPAVVLGPGIEEDVIHGIDLVRLGGRAVLLVVVAESGRVIQQVVELETEPTERQLAKAEGALEFAFSGKRISEVGEGVPLSELSEKVREIVRPVQETLRSSSARTREVYVGGTSQLARLWNDLAVVRRLLAMLEAEASIARLLDAEGTEPAVRFAAELGDEVDVAVVSAGFDSGSLGQGRVGVIGPTRMDYRRTMRVVEEVGESLEEQLGGDR